MSKPAAKKQKANIGEAKEVNDKVKDKKKAPRVIQPQFAESDNLAHTIQENLLASYIGTVRMYSGQLTTNWDSTELAGNRKLVSSATKVLVDEFESRGLKRDLSEHHMSATFPAEYIPVFLSALGLPDIETLKQKSDKGDYPLVTKTINGAMHKDWKGKPVLQGGQHRFAALNEFLVHESDRWWPIRLYNADIVTATSLGHLRSNAAVAHTALSDGRRFLLCFDYQTQIDAYIQRGLNRLNEDDARKYTDLNEAYQLEVSRYVTASKRRHEQVWARIELRDSLASIMTTIPEMTNLFKLPALNDLLSCRCQKVPLDPFFQIVKG